MNWKRLDLPTWADMLIAARAAGFDIDNIIDVTIDVMLGVTEPGDIPAQVLAEIKDVVKAFADRPQQTSWKIGGGIAMNELGFSVIGIALDAVGQPCEKKLGPVTIVYARKPKSSKPKKKKEKKTRKRSQKSVATLEAQLARAKLRAKGK